MKNENFLLTIDNFLNKKECEDLLKTYKNKLKKTSIISKNNYLYKDIDISNFKHLDKLTHLIDLYIKKYPEINMTCSFWCLTSLRFKLFKKGKSFSTFHSEVSMTTPYRILSLQIYLTEHNCGTEFFYNKKTILSKIGRACLFPAYFTHTHKGQPDFNKERCIITGYYSFYKNGTYETNE